MESMDALKSAVPQIYETELHDRETNLSVRFVTVPARSMAEGEILRQPPEAVMEVLELQPLGEPLHASDMAYAMAALLEKSTESNVAFEFFDLVRRNSDAFAHDHPELLAFAEHVTFRSVIPFEHSPLGPDALGSILASGSGIGIGAGVGFMVAGGPTPLLLITVPAGMIICGSAKGVAEGLSEGLRYRIRRLMGLPEEKERVAAEPASA